MAEALVLKVPESQYKATLQDLTRSLTDLGEDLNLLKAQRDKLDTNYSGDTAKLGVEDVDKAIASVKSGIDALEKRKDVIEKFLTQMQSQDSAALGKYKETEDKVSKVFE